uniref:Uncharacterized protein n=1 Tax=Scophthalmus maximus TaxID=52904 RepID=A0A8D3C8R5_SCOMX
MQTMSHRSVRWLAAMLLVALAAGQCQQNESRRAVSEHQLMHDRGRNIQSLKRLIWLSSAMEGLHTAQALRPCSTLTCKFAQAVNRCTDAQFVNGKVHILAPCHFTLSDYYRKPLFGV